MEQTRRFRLLRDRAPERLDRFLAECLPEQTRSQLKKLIDEGRVLVDGLSAKAGCRLKGGEDIAVTLPEPVPAEAVSEEIPLKILFQDRHLIVIDKPAGMVVHPAPGHSRGTLVNALLHHCDDLSGIGGELRPGIVHRLDRQFKAHTITRRYVALVHGLLTEDRGTIDRPIGRHPTQRKKMSSAARTGRRAVTHWRVLQRFEQDRLTLVELTLETGRTHQIRVHFSETQRPIVGDPVYGGAGRTKALGDLGLRRLVEHLNRQALHARLLGFIHPESGEYLEFTSPLPEDMQSIVDYLQRKHQQP
jgi:23S rRNA pseudouridine1911/1915/1917 synthase